MLLRIVITALVCYFLGNHNGAICVSTMLGDDVRSHGSGNAGLTNFIRNFGPGRAAMVIVIDAGKAVLSCVLGGLLFPEAPIAGRLLGGICAMLGHDFPALQGFRGGKGILSGCFVAIAVDWRVAVLVAIVFFTVYFLTKYVSLSSILAAAAFGIGFAIIHHDDVLLVTGSIFISLLTIFQHRSNITRLIHGKESKTDLFQKGTKS